jgi:transposase-like protein
MPRKIVKKLVTSPVKGVSSKSSKGKRTRRVFTEEFRREAVAMSHRLLFMNG